MKRTLKRLFMLSALIFCLTFLSSCFVESCIAKNCGVGIKNRKTNYFFECSFAINYNGIRYYLNISEISKEDFNSANGKNVVEDAVLKENNYFNIDFYYCDEQNNKVSCDFYNLKDEHPNTRIYKANYVDDNGNSIHAEEETIFIYFNKERFMFYPPSGIYVGKFYAVDNGIPYYMEITTISENEFVSANGKNVVKDETLNENNYLKIDFYSFDEDENKITYDFYNLKVIYPGLTANISYIDDNGNTLSPYNYNPYYLSHSIEYNGIGYRFKIY